MSDFFENMRLRYSPKMSPMEFSLAINDVENELFNGNPDLLMLTETEQNRHVEEAYRRSGYVKAQ